MPANLASSRPLRALSLAALALLMAAPALAQSRRQGAELPQMRLSQRPLIVAHRGRATPDAEVWGRPAHSWGWVVLPRLGGPIP